jgi:hypothetical protein
MSGRIVTFGEIMLRLKPTGAQRFFQNPCSRRPSGASIAEAHRGDIDWDRSLAGAAWFHITGITPAISRSASELSLEAVRNAKEKGLEGTKSATSWIDSGRATRFPRG